MGSLYLRVILPSMALSKKIFHGDLYRSIILFLAITLNKFISTPHTYEETVKYLSNWSRYLLLFLKVKLNV